MSIIESNKSNEKRILAYRLSEAFTLDDLMKVSGGIDSGMTNNISIEYTGPSRTHDVNADVNVDW